MRRLFAAFSIMAGSAALLLASLSSTSTPVVASAPAPVVAVARPPQDVAVDTAGFTSQGLDVATYRPQGPIRGVAIFLSGDGGWNLGVVDMAKALAARGVAVAGLSVPAFQKQLEKGGSSCVNPNYALQALAQDYEHRLGLPAYIQPILVGYSSGATIAYAALAQAPAGTWKAAVSLGFGPDIGGQKPWCPIAGVSVTRIAKPEHGWLFGPAAHLPGPWVLLQGSADQVVSADEARRFAAAVPQARLIELPKVGHGFSVQRNWMPQFRAAIEGLLTSGAPASGQSEASVADLPLTVVRDEAAPQTDLMAVLYSGDGGWAGIDRDLAARLAARGVPVVGVDSLRYFWTARTPAQASADAARIVEHFAPAFHRTRVLFVGYSFGADDLPYIVGGLPASVRPAVARVSMLGLSGTADFQFHLASWLDVAGKGALPTRPAVEALRGTPMQCVRGSDEDESGCLSLPAGQVDQIVLAGGHHFGGNDDALAATVLKGLV